MIEGLVVAAVAEVAAWGQIDEGCYGVTIKSLYNITISLHLYVPINNPADGKQAWLLMTNIAHCLDTKYKKLE